MVASSAGRVPFHEVPQVSASAQLASALLAVGEDLPLVAPLVAFVAGDRRASGGWGDAGGPDDVLTTLVAFELLLIECVVRSRASPSRS